jgi:hypothetical protein
MKKNAQGQSKLFSNELTFNTERKASDRGNNQGEKRQNACSYKFRR